MPQRIGDRVLLSTAEAVEVSRLSRVQIQRLLKAEQLEGVKLGHDWLVFEDSLTKYVAQPRKPGPKPKNRQTNVGTSQKLDDTSSSGHTHHNNSRDAQSDQS